MGSLFSSSASELPQSGLEKQLTHALLPVESDLHTLVVLTIPLEDKHVAVLKRYFSKIIHVPGARPGVKQLGNEVPQETADGSVRIVWADGPELDEALLQANVIYGFLPASVRKRSQIPNCVYIQLASAGAEKALDSPIFKEAINPFAPSEKRPLAVAKIRLATAAGVHTGPIPQYFIATTLSLFHHMQEQIVITQTEKRWPSDLEVGGSRMFVQEIRGKTVGVLGYGHIGRESARLSQAFGANIIAANSDGKRKPQDGYRIPGTGDPDGSIPTAWYSTSDVNSFHQFLAAADVVLISLPSTPQTRHILSDLAMSHLKPTAIVVNIGRGDLIDTEALVRALDGGKIAGAALDVTDPEPLPAGHTLFGRRNVIITPHVSGRTEKYFDLATEILVQNVERYKQGRALLNEVDFKKGY